MNTTSPTTHEWRFATDETPSLHLRSDRGDVRLFHDAGPGEVLVRLSSLSSFDPQAFETRTEGRDVFVTVPPTLDAGDNGFGFAFQVGRLSWGIGNANRVNVEVHLSPDADVEVHAEGGDITLEAATGGQVVTQGGDITVGSLDHGALRTGGGDIRVRRLGEGSVKTAGGDVRIDDLGSGRIETGGGDVGVLRAGGDVEVQTGGGDVSLLGCPGQTQVRTGAGDVSVEAEGGSVDVKTGAGDIRITVPRDIPVWQDLHSSFGEVVSRIASRGEPAEGEPFITDPARTGTGDVVLQD